MEVDTEAEAFREFVLRKGWENIKTYFKNFFTAGDVCDRLLGWNIVLSITGALIFATVLASTSEDPVTLGMFALTVAATALTSVLILLVLWFLVVLVMLAGYQCHLTYTSLRRYFREEYEKENKLKEK